MAHTYLHMYLHTYIPVYILTKCICVYTTRQYVVFEIFKRILRVNYFKQTSSVVKGVFEYVDPRFKWHSTLQRTETGWPDWVNFRLLGDCFLWIVFVKIAEVAQTMGLLFPRQKVCSKKMDLANFWATCALTQLRDRVSQVLLYAPRY
jgi:hypothetical protein